jgi:hypothetical protein
MALVCTTPFGTRSGRTCVSTLFSNLLFLALVILFVTSQTIASAPAANADTPVPIKDPLAVAQVQASIDAMGGIVAVSSVNDIVLKGTVHPVLVNNDSQISFVWKISGGEFRTEITRDSGTQIFVSGHGRPAVSRNGEVQALFQHVTLAAPPFQAPASLLVTQLSDSKRSIVGRTTTVLAGKPVVCSLTNSTFSKEVAAISQQVWCFDSSTSLPVRTEYRLPSPTDMTEWIDGAIEYSDFRAVDGLLIPFSVTTYQDGSPLHTLTVEAVAVNTGVPQSDFDLLEAKQ